MCIHVGLAACHLYIHVRMLSRVRLFVTPWTVAPKLLCSWDSSKNPGVGCRFPLQEIFLTPGVKLASLVLAGRF